MKINCANSVSNWTVQGTGAGAVPTFLKTLKQVLGVQGETLSRDKLCHLVRVAYQESHYYVKIYKQGGKGLRRFFGRSRVRAEWENLLLFDRLGIPTAPVVAYGEQRCLGRFMYGAMVTRGLNRTEDLEIHTRNDPQLLRDRTWFNHVMFQVADYTRRLHQVGFAHNDLNWRNILVENDRELPQIYFIDCPSGRRWFWPFRSRKIIKDLAHLDKKGKERLSRTQRLAFYKRYQGIRRLTREDKVYIGQILAFGRRDRQNAWHRILPHNS